LRGLGEHQLKVILYDIRCNIKKKKRPGD
jgi:hypothetical protein